jgi:hypothetical protein
MIETQSLRGDASDLRDVVIKMTDVLNVDPNSGSGIPFVEQPLAKAIENLPQRTTPKLRYQGCSFPNKLQSHDDLLSAPINRATEIIMA